MPNAIILDPLSESSSNSPLPLLLPRDRGTGIDLIAENGHDYPTPEADATWVFSPETEGELRAFTRSQRRVIPVELWVMEPQDATATNKATNPVAGTNTTGWTNNSLVLMERQTTLPARLDGFDTAVHATSNADDDSSYLSAAVSSGVAETFSAWVYVVSGTVRLEVWNATPALNTQSANITAGSWQRIVLPFTPTTSATYTFRVAQNGAGTAEWYVTGMQIGPADPYFDGDTPGAYWTGTRHASSSTRRAPGGARFQGIVNDIEDKVAKLDASGGTFKRTTPNGDVIIFDVQAARIVKQTHDPFNELYKRMQIGIEFTCKPFGRGPEVTV